MRIICSSALLSLFLLSVSVHAATFTVGTCPGATHSDFATAYNALGSMSGPHTLRLCPGSHTTAPLSASWGHQGLTIESLSGNPSDTELIASAGTVLTAASQGFSIRNLRVVGSFGATGFSNISTTNADITGTITTSGNLSINSSTIGGGLTSRNGALTLVDSLILGPIQVQNSSSFRDSSVTGSVTVTSGALTLENGSIDGNLTSNALNASNWNFTGDLSVRAGTVNITGGRIAGNIDGGSQNLNLSGVTMTSGRLQVTGAIISISASQIGAVGSPVPIDANNGITVNDSQIWGDLTAQNWAPIFLNPATTVFGTCTPVPIGGGTCGAAASCSVFIGQATINELRRAGGGHQAFIEVRILDPSIPASVWSDWTLRYCSARTGNCRSTALGNAVVDASGFPWLVLTEAGMVNSNDISLGTPGGGIEVRLNDADGRAIDYLSVAGHQAGLAEACPYLFDTTMTGSNSFGIMRLPDGVGDWTTLGPGNSGGAPTPGAPNDDITPSLPVLEILMEQQSWSGTPREVLDTSGRGLHGTAEGSTNTAVTSPALPGNPGTCRYGEFNGRDSGIFIGNEINYGFGNELTVMAWVRWGIDPSNAPAANRRANIFTSNATTGSGNNGQFWLQHSPSNNAFEIAVRTNETRRALRGTTRPQQGQWYHVAGVWDGNASRLRIYVNGVQEANRSLSGNSVAAASGNATHIGRWSRPGFHRFPGNIDDVRAFDRALDANEITTWMNSRRPCEAPPLDHIRIEHPGAGLSCQAETITVRACADADCSQLFADPVTVNFTSPAGNWSPSSLSFTGQAAVGLQVTQPGSVVLNAVSNPAAPVRCFVGAVESCAMDWAESGFLIEVPDHVSATTAAGRIRAVRSDDETQACVPAFGNVSRDVNLWSQFQNPIDGTQALSVNGVALAAVAPGSALTLAFDADGSAPLNVVYPDVGHMRLHARFEGSGDEQGLVMTGQGSFIARPAGFSLEAFDNPAAGTASGPVFRAAGQPFELVVSALNAAGNITPNFGREESPEGVMLELELLAPAGGVNPGLSGSLNAFGLACIEHGGQPGTACGSEFRFGEVGIMRLRPRLASGSYLGTADVVGDWSNNIGRFIPSHFALSGGTLIDRAALLGCDSDFTYLGERLDAEFTLLARSASDAPTANYTGDFARLGSGQLNLAAAPTPQIDSSAIEWQDGVGLASASLRVNRAQPDGPHEPFELRTAAVDADGVALVGATLIGTTRLLFGRMVIDNAIGSELGPLDLPWRVEVWENATWRVHGADNCTALGLDQQISLSNGHGALVSGADMIAVNAAGDMTSIDAGASELTAVGGRGHFRLAAPLAPGWVEVLLGLDNGWQFLRDDLREPLGEYDDNPTARATWGLFDGNSNRILLREVIPR